MAKRWKRARKQEIAPDKVKMRFSEDVYYRDLKTPIYRRGETYEIEGHELIARWLKRGGEIVEGELPQVDTGIKTDGGDAPEVDNNSDKNVEEVVEVVAEVEEGAEDIEEEAEEITAEEE